MRLFVGISLDPKVAAAAGALVEQLRRRAARLARASRITWIPDARLHLTVRFIGPVDEDRARVMREVLEPPLPIDPFDLTFEGAGAFPKSGAPRVLWVGVTAGRDGLDRVEREVTRRLATVNVPPEDRVYRPHLTLARVREAAGLRSAALFERVEGIALGTSHVDAITLFESRLSPKGPTYVALQTTALQSWNPSSS